MTTKTTTTGQRPKREFNIGTSGQFRTLAIFFIAGLPLSSGVFSQSSSSGLDSVSALDHRQTAVPFLFTTFSPIIRYDKKYYSKYHLDSPES